MHFNNIYPEKADTDYLISDLLGLDTSAFEPTQPADGQDNSSALLGVGALMRRVLASVMQLRDKPRITLHLDNTDTADAKAANLTTIFTWSLIQDYRERKHLPFAVLKQASKRSDVTHPGRFLKMPLAELIAEYQKPVAGDFESHEETVESATHISACATVQSMLGLDPMTLRFYRTDEASAVPVEDSALLACTGLRLLLEDALGQYAIMRARHTTAVRLMSDDDARDARIPGTRPAHIATLLAAALHADAGHKVVFLAAKTRSEHEKAMLLEAAKAVYLDHSEEAQRGLELICDGIVHFGHGTNFTLAERLLFEAARQGCDPEFQRMPYSVSLQLMIEMLAKVG